MNTDNEATDSSLDPAAIPETAAVVTEPSSSPADTLEDETDSLPEEQRKPSLDYPVVGIGASAGGLQAFQELLGSLDPNTGMAFALITHLAPDQRSYLTEILAHKTKMPVSSIEDGVQPEPNHLYVLLPNQIAALDRGVFR